MASAAGTFAAGSAGMSGGFSLFPNTSGTSHNNPYRRTHTPKPTPYVAIPTATMRSSPPPPTENHPQEMTPSHSIKPPPNVAAATTSTTPPTREPDSPKNNMPTQSSSPRPSSAIPPIIRPPSPVEKRKIHLEISPDGEIAAQEEPLRSLFPQYNHSLPADRQEYYPTQSSPTHIPPGVISRPLYSPIKVSSQPSSPPLASEVTTPFGASPRQPRWPPQPLQSDSPVMPRPSSTEELRGLWRVANGWKAALYEGRSYCVKMTAARDAPVYTLSSATQPFYRLRLDPTSASAYVSLSRFDPHKTFKGDTTTTVGGPIDSSNNDGGGSNSGDGDGSDGEPSPPAPVVVKPNKPSEKYWTEVLTTTLEEESRKDPPNDGLVALLYPCAATRLALDHASDASTVAQAEMECARLVWDVDTASHYLVHPALALPFCVTIERRTAWSRTEYTLEHQESPQHLARLTRDGTGEGWLEFDSTIAAKTTAVYLADVAVAALLLVAHLDKQYSNVDVFEPPPVPGECDGGVAGSARASVRNSVLQGMGNIGGGRFSWMGRRDERKEEKKNKTGGGEGSKAQRMEQFELDLESQSSSPSKKKKVRVKDKSSLPWFARGVVKMLTVSLKCIVWAVSLTFKAFLAVMVSLGKRMVREERKG